MRYPAASTPQLTKGKGRCGACLRKGMDGLVQVDHDGSFDGVAAGQRRRRS